jgi:hypothetical protein
MTKRRATCMPEKQMAPARAPSLLLLALHSARLRPPSASRLN